MSDGERVSSSHVTVSPTSDRALVWAAPWVGRLIQATTLALLGGMYAFGPKPSDEELVLKVSWDDLCHATAFAVGTLLCLSAARRLGQCAAVSAVMAGCAFGFEYLQALVPGRGHSLEDIVANLVGVAVALPIGWRLRRNRPPGR